MAVLGRVLEQIWDQGMTFIQGDVASRPRVFAVLVLVILGFVGGRIVAELVRTLLKMTSLDTFAVKSDIQSSLRRFGYRGSFSDLIADLVKWVIYLLAFLSVLYMFGFRFAAAYSAVLLDWSTRILLAAVVLMLGAVIADRLEEVTIRLFRVSRITGLVDEAGADIPVYLIAGKAVKYIGILVTILVALGVAGIDIEILNVLLGIIAFGIVLSLVIGTRDLVRNIAVSIYLQLSRVFGAEDTITVGEHTGEIAGVRPLYTKLDTGDTVLYVPNWKMVTEVVEREEE